jgi:hypothetical protein
LPVILLNNSILPMTKLKNLSFLKIKVQNLIFFKKDSNFQRNEIKKKNEIVKIKKEKVVLQDNTVIKNLSFLTTLIFFFVFFTYPFSSNSNILPRALASKFSKKNLSQKLSQVPVFAVTNATGQPYLANNSNGEQIGLIFFSKEDALAMLRSMQKTHQALEARIYIMGLDKAYRMVLSNASPSGIQGNLGQELKMIFRFYPDQKQIKHANLLKKNINPIESFKGVPVFIADGLTIRKGREEIIPVFLTKEDLEESWNTMCKYNPDQPIKPVILVSSLLELVAKMESDPEEYTSFGFFPPSESVEFVKQENQGNPSARIMPGIFQKI